MRTKKPQLVNTLSETAEASKMEKDGQEHRLPGRLIPIPSQITAGCGLAWKAEPDAKEQFIEQLKQGGISWEQMQIVEL